MKERKRVVGEIKSHNGTHWVVEDRVDMEIHDFIDYAVLKHITKGSKFAALPARLVTDMSREEQRIKEDKSI